MKLHILNNYRNYTLSTLQILKSCFITTEPHKRLLPVTKYWFTQTIKPKGASPNYYRKFFFPMMLSEFSDSVSDSFVCLTQEFPIWGFKIPIKSQIHRHFPIPIAAFVFCRYEVRIRSNRASIKNGISTRIVFFFLLLFSLMSGSLLTSATLKPGIRKPEMRMMTEKFTVSNV